MQASFADSEQENMAWEDKETTDKESLYDASEYDPKETAGSQERPRPTWRPVALRFSVLSLILLLTLALIGLLEYASRVLPSAQPSTNGMFDSSRLVRRQIGSFDRPTSSSVATSVADDAVTGSVDDFFSYAIPTSTSSDDFASKPSSSIDFAAILFDEIFPTSTASTDVSRTSKSSHTYAPTATPLRGEDEEGFGSSDTETSDPASTADSFDSSTEDAESTEQSEETAESIEQSDEATESTKQGDEAAESTEQSEEAAESTEESEEAAESTEQSDEESGVTSFSTVSATDAGFDYPTATSASESAVYTKTYVSAIDATAPSASEVDLALSESVSVAYTSVSGQFTTFQTTMVMPNPTDASAPDETLTSLMTVYIAGHVTSYEMTLEPQDSETGFYLDYMTATSGAPASSSFSAPLYTPTLASSDNTTSTATDESISSEASEAEPDQTETSSPESLGIAISLALLVNASTASSWEWASQTSTILLATDGPSTGEADAELDAEDSTDFGSDAQTSDETLDFGSDAQTSDETLDLESDAQTSDETLDLESDAQTSDETLDFGSDPQTSDETLDFGSYAQSLEDLQASDGAPESDEGLDFGSLTEAASEAAMYMSSEALSSDGASTWSAWLSSIVAPVAVFVLFRQIWIIVYGNVQLMQPFLALSDPNGDLASTSFSSLYLQTGWGLGAFRAYTKRHWLVLFASFGYLVAGGLVILASGTFDMISDASCSSLATSAEASCPLELAVHMTTLRAVQGLLGLSAVLLIAVSISIFRRRPNALYSDPSAIAGIASLVHHPEFVAQFRDIDAMTTTKAMQRSISFRRYRLGTYKTPAGVHRYGFIPVPTGGKVAQSGVSREDSREDSTLDASVQRADQSARRSNSFFAQAMPTLFDLAFLIWLGAFLAALVQYTRSTITGIDDFDEFLNSSSSVPRFALVIFGLLISARWHNLHAEVFGKAIYADLRVGFSRALDSVCLTRPSVALSSLVPSFGRKQFFRGTIALVSVLAEVLIVILPGIPSKNGVHSPSCLTSTYIAAGILALMCLALLSIMIWRVSRVPDLPRATDTLAGVVSYLAISQLPRDCEEMEFLSGVARGCALEGMGKRWCFGAFVGTDGAKRMMVEEDGEGYAGTHEADGY